MNNEKITFAVLSDIHSNYIALKRCLEYIQERGITTLVFLGDYLADMPHPRKTMELLYKLQEQYTCYFVRGNKEDYWQNYRNNRDITWSKGSTGALLYTYEQLTEKDFAFFDSLPLTRTLSFPDLPPITLCHGSPYFTRENMKPNTERTREIMDASDTSLILCGHTHRQCSYAYHGKLVLNGGAVGVPKDSNGQTQFLILHGEKGKWTYEFISLEYDNEKAVAELLSSELNEYAPHWCTITANLLRKGSPSHGAVLAEAMRLCEEETGSAVWWDIPDNFWDIAIKNLISSY